MNRTKDTPIYEQRNDTVDARLFNLWRRARIHELLPQRFEEPDTTPGIAIIADISEWVCVNIAANDLPILAWVDFENRERNSLHIPVCCKLNYYHFAASRYRARSLEILYAGLEQCLLNPENDPCH